MCRTITLPFFNVQHLVSVLAALSCAKHTCLATACMSAVILICFCPSDQSFDFSEVHVQVIYTCLLVFYPVKHKTISYHYKHATWAGQGMKIQHVRDDIIVNVVYGMSHSLHL